MSWSAGGATGPAVFMSVVVLFLSVVVVDVFSVDMAIYMIRACWWCWLFTGYHTWQ